MEERVTPGMPRPRIGDVAAKAGVSKTAVSFAFNQPDRLNEATRLRILEAAAELGYRWWVYFNDSFSYVSTAVTGTPDPARVSGYSLFLRALMPLPSFAELTSPRIT